MWGFGWPGYDAGRTLQQNLTSDGWDPDWIWAYKLNEYQEPEGIALPKLVLFNETIQNSRGNMRPIVLDEARAVTVIGFHHENDWAYWRDQLPQPSFYVPHCADPNPAPLPFANRPVGVLLTGRVSESVYPLRTRMCRMMKPGPIRSRLPRMLQGPTIAGTVRPHPGYVLQSHENIISQYCDYRRDLARARITLSCTSVESDALAKLFESMAEGCLVMSDLPDSPDFQASFGEAIVAIDRSMSDRQIAETVAWWSNHPREAEEKARLGYDRMVKGYTLAHYADRLVAILKNSVIRIPARNSALADWHVTFCSTVWSQGRAISGWNPYYISVNECVV